MQRKEPPYVYDRTKLPELLAVYEAAAFLRVSETTVLNRIKAGKIKAFVDGKIIRIPKNAILEYAGLKDAE